MMLKNDVVSNKLKSIKSDIEYFIEEMKYIDVDKYEWMKEDIGLKCIVKNVVLKLKDEKCFIEICSVVVDINNDGKNCNVERFEKIIKIDVEKIKCEMYFDLIKEEEEIKNELFEIMNLIEIN